MNATTREGIALAAAIDAARHISEMYGLDMTAQEVQELGELAVSTFNVQPVECEADSDYDWLT